MERCRVVVRVRWVTVRALSSPTVTTVRRPSAPHYIICSHQTEEVTLKELPDNKLLEEVWWLCSPWSEVMRSLTPD